MSDAASGPRRRTHLRLTPEMVLSDDETHDSNAMRLVRVTKRFRNLATQLSLYDLCCDEYPEACLESGSLDTHIQQMHDAFSVIKESFDEVQAEYAGWYTPRGRGK